MDAPHVGNTTKNDVDHNLWGVLQKIGGVSRSEGLLQTKLPCLVFKASLKHAFDKTIQILNIR